MGQEVDLGQKPDSAANFTDVHCVCSEVKAGRR